MSIQSIWTQIKEFFAKIPPKYRWQLVVLVAVVLALAITVGVLVSRTTWVVLPTGDNAPQIHEALRDMNVPMRVEGNRIYVPEQMRDEIRMELRSQGLIGIAYFDREGMENATGFGVTDLHAREVYNHQLGEDIRSMLRQMPMIHDALVLVSRGETSPFRVQQNLNQASASVMLTLRGNVLTPDQAQAVATLVRGAVPGIEYENIVITDDAGNHHRVGDAALDVDNLVSLRFGLENVLADRTKNQVEELLAPIFGPVNIRVQPHVRLNFDDIYSEEVVFAPPVPGELEGMIRSMEQIDEQSRRWDVVGGIPGTDTNAMGTAEYPWGPMEDGLEYRRRVLGSNYELNELRTRIDHEQGVVQELSVGIFVDSEIEGINWDAIDFEEISDVIARAVGISSGNVSMSAIPFSYEDTTWAEMAEAREVELAREQRNSIIEMIITGAVIVALGFMVFLLGKTIIKALQKPPPETDLMLAAGPEGLDIMISDDEFSEELTQDEIAIVQKPTSLDQIEKFIEKDSATVAQLLKNWLVDD